MRPWTQKSALIQPKTSLGKDLKNVYSKGLRWLYLLEVEEEEGRADAERERKRKVAKERRKREKVQADVATVQSDRKGGKGKGESVEYRQAPDGRWYTDQEFWRFYARCKKKLHQCKFVGSFLTRQTYTRIGETYLKFTVKFT